MPSDTLKSVASQLVENCRTGNEEKGLKELYAEDAVSVEAADVDGSGRQVSGLDGIRGKHAWWDEHFEVHSSNVDGPYLHGDDQFSVVFEVDATDKARGARFQMKEVAVYTLNAAGKIAREAFFMRT
ncbi:nuclear transport factor 2 family protein [Rhodobacteraceae bacterium 2CG4]|uniref:Nuclear transport factor 2 family protein n=1 Tax=Halovulum marinum TaxID=2662447 RepID=A0A6L5YZ26_9RHOB|nr:SnoaL-like domain-containing protein [Halovulum marinum]MSU89537.1 nuclear transport factor 2 family protein [Halovulum marinum]